jgi:hypothetical protein|tara:strand:+ start:1160 stop:1720 length:561 start_codon:yes stop_codon:yes gene_type:complete
MIPKSINHLTESQWECLNQAYKGLKCNYDERDWFRDSAKRAITRGFYMQCKSFKTGFISNNAYLAKGKGNVVCFDHCCIPQAYCFFIMKHWETIGESLDSFFPHWVIASLGIDVTSEENKKLSKYTVNNKSTGNLLKVKVPLVDRYKKSKITILDAETLKEVDFDVIGNRLDEGFAEWEKMELLID